MKGKVSLCLCEKLFFTFALENTLTCCQKQFPYITLIEVNKRTVLHVLESLSWSYEEPET